MKHEWQDTQAGSRGRRDKFDGFRVDIEIVESGEWNTQFTGVRCPGLNLNMAEFVSLDGLPGNKALYQMCLVERMPDFHATRDDSS